MLTKNEYMINFTEDRILQIQVQNHMNRLSVQVLPDFLTQQSEEKGAFRFSREDDRVSCCNAGCKWSESISKRVRRVGNDQGNTDWKALQ